MKYEINHKNLDTTTRISEITNENKKIGYRFSTDFTYLTSYDCLRLGDFKKVFKAIRENMKTHIGLQFGYKIKLSEINENQFELFSTKSMMIKLRYTIRMSIPLENIHNLSYFMKCKIDKLEEKN